MQYLLGQEGMERVQFTSSLHVTRLLYQGRRYMYKIGTSVIAKWKYLLFYKQKVK